MAAGVPVLVPGAEFMAVGVGDCFGLNRRGNLNLNFRGVGDGIGVGVGLGDASTLLRVRFGFGKAAGNLAAEADAVLSGLEIASVLFRVCFGGEGDSGGVPVNSCD